MTTRRSGGRLPLNLTCILLLVGGDAQAKEQIQRCSKVYHNLVVLDLRAEETIFATNRFTIYSLIPNCNVSMHVLWGKQKENTVFTIGKSVLDRSCRANIGDMCLEYGGGGHQAAGTCQVAHEDSERVMSELIARINAAAGIESATILS